MVPIFEARLETAPAVPYETSTQRSLHYGYRTIGVPPRDPKRRTFRAKKAECFRRRSRLFVVLPGPTLNAERLRIRSSQRVVFPATTQCACRQRALPGEGVVRAGRAVQTGRERGCCTLSVVRAHRTQ